MVKHGETYLHALHGRAEFVSTLRFLSLGFFSFVLVACVEDDAKPVQQVGILVVKTTWLWKVIPLHRLAYDEHTEYRMNVSYSLTGDVIPSLLD